MKKIISVLLTLSMLAAFVVVPTFAAETTAGSVAADYKPAEGAVAVTNEAEFLAMAADGNYYLANDITLAAPYATAFTGTFDGCGKKVTVSCPMFIDFGGTAKNLVIEGSVTSLAADAEIAVLADNGARGAVACRVNSGTEVVFENIANNAAVSAIGSLSSDDCAGAIVGKIELDGVSVKFINCVNNAPITGLNQVGGILGWAKTAAATTFDGCVNNADIIETGSSAYCAGISGRNDALLNTYVNCVNNGKVSSGKDQAGGMIAYSAKGAFTFDKCVNNGEIAPTVGKAAGLVANINCKDADGKAGYFVIITNCVNTGKVTAGGDGNYAAGIAATVQNNLNFTISNCINYGDIYGTHDSGGVVGHTTQAIMTMSFCENNGTVTTESDQYAGGVCGYAWGTKTATVSAVDGQYANKIEFCINNGKVVADSRAGGIVGSTGTTDSRGISLVNFCINTGEVTTKGTGGKFSQNTAGGIQGYGYGTEDTAYPVVTNCINTGNVIALNSDGTGANAAYFLGYVNSTLAIISNNTATGTLTSESGNITALGRNESHEYKAENLTGNSIPSGTSYALTYEANKDEAGNVVPVEGKTYEVKATDATTFTSGKLVYELNATAKALGATSDLVYMTVDGTFAPTLVPEVDDKGNVLNSVVMGADGSYSNPVIEEETTAPDTTAPDTTEPGASEDTGDSAIIFAAIAIIAIAGVAVVSKKREN